MITAVKDYKESAQYLIPKMQIDDGDWVDWDPKYKLVMYGNWLWLRVQAHHAPLDTLIIHKGNGIWGCHFFDDFRDVDIKVKFLPNFPLIQEEMKRLASLMEGAEG